MRAENNQGISVDDIGRANRHIDKVAFSIIKKYGGEIPRPSNNANQFSLRKKNTLYLLGYTNEEGHTGQLIVVNAFNDNKDRESAVIFTPRKEETDKIDYSHWYPRILYIKTALGSEEIYLTGLFAKNRVESFINKVLDKINNSRVS